MWSEHSRNKVKLHCKEFRVRREEPWATFDPSMRREEPWATFDPSMRREEQV